MPNRLRTYSRVVIGICLILTFCIAEGDAQTRKKRRTRRAAPAAPKPVITNPTIAPPESTTATDKSSTGDVKIISTADPTTNKDSSENLQGWKPKVTAAEPNDQEQVQQTITTLSNQVNKLNEKLGRMQEDDRYQLDMERLTRAEQRAEQLRSQLMDIQSKIADFEAKLEQIEFALRPENLEGSMAGYGSTRPEQAREARKKQLEGERSRTQAQLKLADTSRSRLEVAVANADSEVDMLRAKLNQMRDQMDAAPRKP